MLYIEVRTFSGQPTDDSQVISLICQAVFTAGTNLY
jgi:hypothetical protein